MNYMQLAVAVLGGLAIFVYGMGLMSDGLTQIAGARMKAILSFMTRNRFAAIASGALVTAAIQSSSATSVMTVGFVNAGLLSLQQAIGVIFGANIGTTITGQLVSFKLDDLALPAVIIGVVGLMVAKKDKFRGVFRTILGFGLLFYGMNLMSHELKAVSKQESFIAFFRLFDCQPGANGFLPLFSVLGAIAVGTLCTMLVQSSSATIGITIALAETGLINIWTGIPIVLGDNIGTTITAILASINTNANARRTALAHALFNIIGTLILLVSFFAVITVSNVKAPAFFHLVNMLTGGNCFAGENLGRHVAMAHTVFNLANVVVLSLFIPVLARVCCAIISSDHVHSRTVVLEPHLLATPAFALEAVRRALVDMTRRAWTVASVAINNCVGRANVDYESIMKAEKNIDEMQTNIRDYLIGISQRKLSDGEAQAIPEYVHCINDAERISDIAVKIYKKTLRVRDEGLKPEIMEKTSIIVNKVRDLANETIQAIRKGTDCRKETEEREDEIHDLVRSLTKEYSKVLVNNETDAPDVAFLSVLSGLRDISRHLGNIAQRVKAMAC